MKTKWLKMKMKWMENENALVGKTVNYENKNIFLCL